MGGAEALLELGRGQSALGVGAHDAWLLLTLRPVAEHEGGQGRIISNRVHSNSYAGIEIKDVSSPEVRGNDVYSGRTSGMYVHSGGTGIIEGNRIHQNWLHGT